MSNELCPFCKETYINRVVLDDKNFLIIEPGYTGCEGDRLLFTHEAEEEGESITYYEGKATLNTSKK